MNDLSVATTWDVLGFTFRGERDPNSSNEFLKEAQFGVNTNVFQSNANSSTGVLFFQITSTFL